MELVVADGPNGEREQQVFTRVVDPDSSVIRNALFGDAPIHYGTHFILSGSDAGELTALCTSGPWVSPGEPGEFLLYVDGELVADRVSRERALEHLLAAFRTGV